MRGTRTTPNDCGGCGQKIPLTNPRAPDGKEREKYEKAEKTEEG
jgi:hypothetical protein